MNNDFIKIKSLEGDYKIYHRKDDVGITVTTKELVFQKPHVTYQIKLEDIVSMVPYEGAAARRPLLVKNEKAGGSIVTPFGSGRQPYRLHVKQATVHNRSGVFQTSGMEFILPLIADLLSAISKYSGMQTIAGDVKP